MIFQIGDLIDYEGRGYVVRGAHMDDGFFSYMPTKAGDKLYITLKPIKSTLPNWEIRLNELERLMKDGRMKHYPIKKESALSKMKRRMHVESSQV